MSTTSSVLSETQKNFTPTPSIDTCRWAKVCLIIITIVAFIIGALSLAQIGILRSIGTWGWLFIGGGAVTSLICFAIMCCCQRKKEDDIEYLGNKIENAAYTKLERTGLLPSQKAAHVQTNVFLFWKRKDTTLALERNFKVSDPDRFREELSSHLKMIDNFSFATHDIEFVCITKLQKAGGSPTYEVKREYYPAGEQSQSDAMTCKDSSDLILYLSSPEFVKENLGHALLHLAPQFQFPLSDIT